MFQVIQVCPKQFINALQTSINAKTAFGSQIQLWQLFDNSFIPYYLTFYQLINNIRHFINKMTNLIVTVI